MTKGKLIVIEGGDGSGKTVQSKLLVDYLKSQGKKVEYIEFPRYKKSFYGALVGRFLSGEFGTLNDVSPYLSAVIYALDRLSAREEMVNWLKRGSIVVVNRYVPSNMAHQAAKVGASEREKLISWIEEMEYEENKLPRPDMVIYLFVPWQIGMELSVRQGKNDIAEQDVNHRKNTEALYKGLTERRKTWKRIDCAQSGSLRTKADIHKEIVLSLKTVISSS